MRLFIAIEPPKAAVEYLSRVIEKLCGIEKLNVQWVAAENLHITLAFLGEVDVSRIPEIGRIMKEIVHGMNPFVLGLSHVGAFPELAAPRVVWYGLERSKNLEELAKKLSARLIKAGFELENREFSPHITLARSKEVKRNHAFVEAAKNFPHEDCMFPCTEVVLYSSLTNGDVTTYDALARSALAKA